MQKRLMPGLCVAVAVIFAGGASLGQDSQALVKLLPDDPNGFVRSVQERMAGAGRFDGRVNGLLDQATISAINAMCRDAGVLAGCQIGPLTPEGAAAVVGAIDQLGGATQAEESAPPPATTPSAPETPAVASPTPAEAPAEAAPEPAPEVAAPPAAPATQAVQIAAEDWEFAPSFGLAAAALATSTGTVEYEISGTAEGRGWINFNAGKPLAAKPGTAWSFSMEGGFSSSADATASLRIAARRADGSYIGELMPSGTKVSGNGTFVVEGTTPAETAFVQPYIQVVYPAGSEADGVLQIMASSVTAN